MLTRRSFIAGGAAAAAGSAEALRTCLAAPSAAPASGKIRPLMKRLMGLNGHTVMFRPALYRPVCELVRDYHNLDWDIGTDTSYAPKFPMSRNQVNWSDLYGSWKKEGFDIDVCAQFGQIKPDTWKDMAKDAHAYGLAFAKYFGPSGDNKLASSIEIGNEPGNYPDDAYRTLFENMARGVREGDPQLKIATCAAVPGKSQAYAKSLSCVRGLESLYDVINMHTYAFAEQYPTWRRSYPEDPLIRYLVDVQDTIAWRDAHAPGKEVWITEFGWDASTQPPPKTGDFSRWMSSTETQQAQYLVRSFLVFSSMDIDRAYIYFFDDNDEPKLHGSSGITRKFVPKPAYYAVAHLYRTLGEYRYGGPVMKEQENVYVHQYVSPSKRPDTIWAVWSPTGSGREADVVLPVAGANILRAEQMPLKAGVPAAVKLEPLSGPQTRVTVSESPIYLWIRKT